MTDKTLGAYQRTTPDPDETTGEALARLQAEMTQLLDEADAELRDAADGGVAAALIEQEAEKHDAAEVRELRSVLAREVARGNALQDALDAAESRPLTPDAITDEMVERGAVAAWRGDISHPDWTFEDISEEDQAWYRDNARAVLTAALTEPPARPEGAEELGELIGTWTASEDIAPAQLPTGSLATLADFLAERGVRVVADLPVRHRRGRALEG